MKNDYPTILSARCRETLGCKFKDNSLLVTAFTHSSYANENGVCSNERLEFLGDSVLGLAVAHYLYVSYPLNEEGFYSKVKAATVSTDCLYSVMRELSLVELLRVGGSSVGRKNKKLYANLFEAIIGAVFLDKGLDKAEEFVLRFLADKIDDTVRGGNINDYKTELYEFVQKRRLALEYRLIGRTGPDHNPSFCYAVIIEGKEYGRGDGGNKSEAQIAAAKAALKSIKLHQAFRVEGQY